LRFAAFWAVVGVILNRINVSIITLNWLLPHHLKEIIPGWKEAWVVLTIVTIHIMIFRWILNRMPVLHADADYAVH
jgi:hypothetical protein